MTDICTYNACPMCGADELLLDTDSSSVYRCKQCGYDGSDYASPFKVQITLNATTNGNISASILLPNGTVDTSNISGDMSSGGTFSVPIGTVITFTSTPNEHYNHGAWTGSVGTASGPLNTTAKLIVDGRKTFTVGATYTAQQKIDWSCTAHGEATITYTLAGVEVTDTIDEEDNGDIYIDNATVVTLTSVPDSGYLHKTWAMNDAENLTSGNNTTLSISWTIVKYTAIDYAQQLINAAFAITYIYDNATTDPTVIEEVSADGTNVTITFSPASGEKVDYVYFVDTTDGTSGFKLTATTNKVTHDFTDKVALAYYAIVHVTKSS